MGIPKTSSKDIQRKGSVDKLEYARLIGEHIDRMSKCITELKYNGYREGVNFLEIILTPIYDKKYKEKFDDNNVKYNKEKDDIKKLKDKKDPTAQADRNNINRRFRACMELLGRYGLLPSESGEFDEGSS